MTRRLRAGIVGLGQVGMLFDDDRRRQGVWTHFTAYERLPRLFDLVAVCEPDAGRRERALKRRPVKAYAALGTMLSRERLDVVSLCTPPAFHAAQILACAGRVGGIICEKPLADTLPAGRKAVEACRKRGTRLVVNYYKRFERAAREAAGLLERDALGTLHRVQGRYSGPLGAVGSHMIDLLRFFAGELTLVQAWPHRGQDEAFSACLSAGPVLLSLDWTGPRENLIFEVDLIGSKGRIEVLENGAQLRWRRFRPSARYSGYRELVSTPAPAAKPAERFLPLFQEMHAMLSNVRQTSIADGGSALKTQRLLDQIRKDAKDHARF